MKSCANVGSEGEKFIVLMDYARPRTAKNAQKKREELGIELVPYAPYSHDLAPTESHVHSHFIIFLRNKLH